MTDYHPTSYQPQPQQPPRPYPPAQSWQSPISQPFPQPYQQQQHQSQQYPPPPRPPGRRTRIVLLVACAVAFAAAAVFGGLYVGADGDHDAAAVRLEERKGQLADVREQITATAAEKADAEERNAGLEAEKATLTTCVDAVQHYLWDGLAGTARDAAVDSMFTACQ